MTNSRNGKIYKSLGDANFNHYCNVLKMTTKEMVSPLSTVCACNVTQTKQCRTTNGVAFFAATKLITVYVDGYLFVIFVIIRTPRAIHHVDLTK